MLLRTNLVSGVSLEAYASPSLFTMNNNVLFLGSVPEALNIPFTSLSSSMSINEKKTFVVKKALHT